MEKLKTYEISAKEIPNYWLKVLQNAEVEDALKVSERDEEALRALKRIECVYLEK